MALTMVGGTFPSRVRTARPERQAYPPSCRCRCTRATVRNGVAPAFSASVRGFALAAAILVTNLFPSRATAAPWSVFLVPQASIPINLMTDYYGPSPSLGIGVGFERESVEFRLTGRYTALRSTVSALPETAKYLNNPATPRYDPTWIPTWVTSLDGTVHHVSLTADLVIPRAFDIRWLRLIGGLGVGVRRLNEGRQFDETTLDEHRTEIRTRIRRGFGEPTVDLVGRIGVEIRIWEARTWSLWGEALYEASYAEINPPGISLDLRVDEMIRTGLVFALNRGRHRN